MQGAIANTSFITSQVSNPGYMQLQSQTTPAGCNSEAYGRFTETPFYGNFPQNGPLGVSLDRHDNGFSKPKCSYIALIGMALKTSTSGALLVQDIYKLIEEKFPYFKSPASGAWKNSLRHSLSHGNCFHKLPAKPGFHGRKGYYWTVMPEKQAAVDKEIAKYPVSDSGHCLLDDSTPPAESHGVRVSHDSVDQSEANTNTTQAEPSAATDHEQKNAESELFTQLVQEIIERLRMLFKLVPTTITGELMQFLLEASSTDIQPSVTQQATSSGANTDTLQDTLPQLPSPHSLETADLSNVPINVRSDPNREQTLNTRGEAVDSGAPPPTTSTTKQLVTAPTPSSDSIAAPTELLAHDTSAYTEPANDEPFAEKSLEEMMELIDQYVPPMEELQKCVNVDMPKLRCSCVDELMAQVLEGADTIELGGPCKACAQRNVSALCAHDDDINTCVEDIIPGFGDSAIFEQLVAPPTPSVVDFKTDDLLVSQLYGSIDGKLSSKTDLKPAGGQKNTEDIACHEWDICKEQCLQNLYGAAESSKSSQSISRKRRRSEDLDEESESSAKKHCADNLSDSFLTPEVVDIAPLGPHLCDWATWESHWKHHLGDDIDQDAAKESVINEDPVLEGFKLASDEELLLFGHPCSVPPETLDEKTLGEGL